MAKTTKAAEVKTEVVEKVTAAAETIVEKVAPVKKLATKKTTAKKTETKTGAKTSKSEAEVKIEIQANGSAITTDALVEKAKIASGVNAIKKVDVYVRPEVNKVYYVVNGDTFGDFDLFA